MVEAERRYSWRWSGAQETQLLALSEECTRLLCPQDMNAAAHTLAAKATAAVDTHGFTDGRLDPDMLGVALTDERTSRPRQFRPTSKTTDSQKFGTDTRLSVCSTLCFPSVLSPTRSSTRWAPLWDTLVLPDMCTSAQPVLA